ncbi:MAG: hypothetical protein WCP29_11395 [Acidobacteriota bacterium]
MQLDLRLPIGLMFGTLGVLLAGYGLLSDPALYRVSLGVNVNLWTGLGMLAFAACMLGGTWRTARKTRARRRPPA